MKKKICLMLAHLLSFDKLGKHSSIKSVGSDFYDETEMKKKKEGNR